MKYCSRCKIEKELELFSVSKITKDKKQSWCKLCQKEYAQIPEAKAKRLKWANENRDVLRKACAKWRLKNKGHGAAAVKEYYNTRKADYIAIQDKYQSKIPPSVYAITYLGTVVYIGKAARPLMRVNVHLSHIKTRNNITKVNKLFSFCGYDRKDFDYKILEEGPWENLLKIEAKWEYNLDAKGNYKKLLPDALTLGEIRRRFFGE